MKLLKTILFFVFLLGSLIKADFINFELWNKHTQNLNYAISDSLNGVLTSPIQTLSAGKWLPLTVNTAKPTFLLISLRPIIKGSLVDIYEFKPFKDIYVRVALLPERTLTRFLKMLFGIKYFQGTNYIFGPQTGPLLGARQLTERGYDLANNVTFDDITRYIRIYRGPDN